MTNNCLIVTGAAGGIGSKVCLYFAQRGFQVFAMDNNYQGITALDHENIIPVEVELNKKSSIEDAVRKIESKTNHITGLINIAGMFDQFPLMEVDNDRFDRLIQINFIGQHYLTRALFPLIFRSKGRIINLSSETVLSPMPLQSYAFSKKLFEVWNDQLRIELELLGIKVIKIRSGGHKTPFIGESLRVLSAYNNRSRYSKLFEKIRIMGSEMLRRVNKDPQELAQIIANALQDRNPSKVYHVNVSMLFKVLSIIPTGPREGLMIRRLKRWM